MSTDPERIRSFHHPSLNKPYPRNWAPEGPTSMSLLARPSPSTIGGMVARRCLFTSRHVTRVGALHFLGGMMMRRPLCRQPRIAPPLASTMKLTRKLRWRRRCLELKTFIIDPFSHENLDTVEENLRISSCLKLLNDNG